MRTRFTACGAHRHGAGARRGRERSRGDRARAQQKISQADAKYQAQPKDGQQCDGCMQFQAPNACKIVDGNDQPDRLVPTVRGEAEIKQIHASLKKPKSGLRRSPAAAQSSNAQSKSGMARGGVCYSVAPAIA